MLKNKAIRAAAIVLALILAALLIPSPLPVAGAEDLPVYSPVTLGAESIDPISFDEKAPYLPHEAAFTADMNGYLDNTISVRIESILVGKTRVWLTWVQIADASQLRTACYKSYTSKAEGSPVSMAMRENAVLTINGDYPAVRNSGIVIRNKKQIRTAKSAAYDGLIIDAKGDFHILQAPLGPSYDDFDGEILHAFTFGPGLVIDGQLVSDFKPELEGPLKASGGTQRCVLCQMDTLSYLIISAEGPEQSYNGGLTVRQAAQLAYDLGAKQAYNLDGGSSTWLILGSKRINAPTGKKRPIIDVIYFVTGEPAPEPTPEPSEEIAAEETPAPAQSPSVVVIGE